MDITRLVKKAKRGNKKALLRLIMGEKDVYYRLAFTYMKNKEDAMDVVVDMTVKVYENIVQLKQDEAFYSWSKTILVNHCKRTLRKQKRESLIENNEADSHNPYETSEQKMDIHALLQYVSTVQREAIQLKYFHDLDYQMISAMTGVPVGTVKSRIFQGLKTMRKYDGGGIIE